MPSALTSKDVQRYGIGGDPGFSEARNRAVIDATIKKTDEIYKQKKAMAHEGIAERADLVYSYIRHLHDTGSDMQIEDYAGWEEMKKIWGLRRITDMRERYEMEKRLGQAT